MLLLKDSNLNEATQILISKIFPKQTFLLRFSQLLNLFIAINLNTNLIFSSRESCCYRCYWWKHKEEEKMESEAESRGRFKVSVAPPPDQQAGRFRLIQPQGSPFLQRGRFSVIPEEETGSPLLTQPRLSGPKIVVDASPEWDFVSTFTTVFRKLNLQYSVCCEFMKIIWCQERLRILCGE